MSDYDSNYNYITCPHCEENISKNKPSEKGGWVYDLEDEEEGFFQCQKCGEFFKARLDIFKEYVYEITEPTNEEIEKHNLITGKKEDKIKDVDGQLFFNFPDKG